MPLRIQVTDIKLDKVTPIEVDLNTLVSDLKAIIEAEFNIPIAKQVLRYGQTVLQDNDPLSKYGIQDEDVVLLSRLPKMVDPLLQEASKVIRHYLSHPEQLAYLREEKPELAHAIEQSNKAAVKQFIISEQQRKFQEQQEFQMRIQQLEQDPFNPENQKLIEEMIQKKNIAENRQFAEEFLPESFVQVTMLYIEISINGQPVQAFVDSGAQSTIMSRACAERCGLMRLVDTRFKGVAMGVGTQKILGRVHVVQMQILDKFLQCSLTILDGDSIDFLLGLDMLRRFQCILNLKENCLVFPNEGVSVRFLQEREIHKRISIEQDQQVKQQEQRGVPQVQPTQPQSTQPQQNQQPQLQTQPHAQTQPQPQQQQPQQQPPQQQSVPVPKSQRQPQNQSRSQFLPQTRPNLWGPQQLQQMAAQIPQQHIQTLKNMGATQEQAIMALIETGGNLELAAALIAQQNFGF